MQSHKQSEDLKTMKPTRENPRVMYKKGQSVEYYNDNEWIPVTIKATHTDDPTGDYYTITLDKDGSERQTESGRLRFKEEKTPARSAGGWRL